MKASGIVALTLLSAAAAAPHKQHVQLHQNKRDMVWVTETEILIETVYQTTTAYVNPGDAAPTSAPAATTEAALPATTEEPSFTEPSSTPEPTTIPSSTPTSAYIAPTTLVPVSSSSAAPSSTYVAPTTLVPVVSSSAAPSSTYVAPSSTAVQSSAAPAASAASGSTSVNAAEVHTAHLTYYSPDVGLSYCGVTYANTQPVVALASGQMSQAMCNKKIKIAHGGKTVDAFIGDSCPGCPGTYGLDLSPSLFESLTPLADGVIDGATWWFA